MNGNDQEYLIRKLHTQYTEKEHTELDALKALDRKVKAPASRFGWSFGVLAALVMGSGMSLVMTDIGATLGLGDPMVPGIAIGLAGMAMAIVNYPIYKAILAARRKKYAPQILSLSEKLLETK